MVSSKRAVALVAGALACALLLLTGTGPVTAAPVRAAAAPGCTVDAVLVNSCRPWFGLSANGYPQTTGFKIDQMKYAEQRIGRQLDVAHTYHTAGDNVLSSADLYFATRPSTLLLTNWQLTRTWSAADGSNATVNADIDKMAASISALGDTKVFLTLFHEPENDLTVAPAACPGVTVRGTSGTAEQYRAMWRNVRARFDAAGVDNVVWVMDYMNYAPYNCLVVPTYPGDDLVDWVLFNGYQHNDTDVSFPHRVSNMYDLLSASSTPEHDFASKPWGIAEWGINASTQANAMAYYDSARTAVEAGTFPRLKLFMNFDATDTATGDGSYRVAYGTEGVLDPAEQASFNAFANSPALTGAWTFPDVTAPSAPGDVAVTLVDGVPRVTWSAASDDRAVSSYVVLRGGSEVGSTEGLTFDDPGAPQGATGTWTVRAVDTSGNAGPDSAGVSLDVPDTTAPSAPSGLTGTLVGGQPSLTWSAASDNVAVTSYTVLRDGLPVATTSASTWAQTGAAAGTYSYSVRAIDAAGNVGPESAPVSVRIGDTTAPTAPGSVTGTLVSNRPRIAWTAASDNVGVTGYDVLRGGVVVATTTALTWTDTSAPQGRSSTYTVRARDAAGNTGPVGRSVSLTVRDTTAPTAPPSLTLVRARTSARLTWTRATDNVAVTRYYVYRGTTRVASLAAATTTTTVSGLTASTRYTFRVVALDAAGNTGPGASVTG